MNAEALIYPPADLLQRLLEALPKLERRLTPPRRDALLRAMGFAWALLNADRLVRESVEEGEQSRDLVPRLREALSLAGDGEARRHLEAAIGAAARRAREYPTVENVERGEVPQEIRPEKRRRGRPAEAAWRRESRPGLEAVIGKGRGKEAIKADTMLDLIERAYKDHGLDWWKRSGGR